MFDREVIYVFYCLDFEVANGMSFTISIYTLLERWPSVIVSWCEFPIECISKFKILHYVSIHN